MNRTSRIGFRTLLIAVMLASAAVFMFSGMGLPGILVPTAAGVEWLEIGFPAFISVSSIIFFLRSRARLQRALWLCAAGSSLVASFLKLVMHLRPALRADLAWLPTPVGYLFAGLFIAALLLRPETWQAYQRQ